MALSTKNLYEAIMHSLRHEEDASVMFSNRRTQKIEHLFYSKRRQEFRLQRSDTNSASALSLSECVHLVWSQLQEEVNVSLSKYKGRYAMFVRLPSAHTPETPWNLSYL